MESDKRNIDVTEDFSTQVPQNSQDSMGAFPSPVFDITNQLDTVQDVHESPN